MVSNEVIEAYVGGLSVMEIARIIDGRPGDIHKGLREAKAIEPLTRRGEVLDTSKCNSVWLYALNGRGLSLERWSQGWCFDLSDVLAVAGEDAENRLQGDHYSQIRRALGRDLPASYKTIYREDPVCLQLKRGGKKQHFGYSISWDEERNRYASVVSGLAREGEASPTGYGLTPGQALDASIKAAREFQRARRLQKAMEVVQGWHSKL